MAELSEDQKKLVARIEQQRNEMLLDFGNYLFSRQREEDLAFMVYPSEQVRIDRFRKVLPIDITNWQLRKAEMMAEKSENPKPLILEK